MLSTRPAIRCDVLVPTHDNDGHAFGPEQFHAFEHFLVGLAGGFTLRGEVDGTWRSPQDGRLMADRSRAYTIVLDSNASAMQHVTDIDTYIKRTFGQQAAYVELIPTRATAF